ncbi:MAG: type VI secretion system membrane subunit TssM [Bacteroidota bacterium]
MTWLTSKGFWIGLGVVLVVLLVLLAALVMEWSLVVTGLALAVALLLVGLALMMRQMKAAQASSGLEQQLMAQAASQQQNVRPDQQAEIEQLQADLERAIETLKQSKLGKKGWRPGGGKAALYALPWYLFIGPPGAGKTTAIANSGLSFPVGTDRVRGVGGTRDCDWFFTDQAILLDTAGRYVTEREDNDEWIAFLEILKKHRKERPINGVLVGIALDELAGASPAEIERHADTVRARIDELIRHLGIRFPVYLLFTKTDLLQGFVEFFGEFDRREREVIWGATLEPDAAPEAGFRALFEREFDRLAEALSGFRSRRLRRAMKREERKLVYNFPLQFASLRGALGPFVARLFQPNPYQETPIFRGFYFTSGTQEGVPIDHVIRAIEAEFDLPPEMTPLGAETEAKSYFIKDVFTEVVIPDQYLGRQTSRAATQRRLARAGTSAAAVAALVLFLLGASQAVFRSKSDLDRARDAASEAALVRWDDRRPSIANLDRMTLLRDEIDRLGGGPPLLQLGLNRRGTVLEPARALYHARARAFVEAYPLATLRDRLGRVASDSSARRSAYEDLKAYLLLTSDAQRLDDEANAAFLQQYLTDVTYGSLYGADSTSAIAPAGIDRHLAAFVEGLDAAAVAPFEPEAGLVLSTRDLIYEQPSVRGVYNRLRSEGSAVLPPVRLAEVVPPRFHAMFQLGEGGGPRVPGFFTQRGWDEFARQAFETESEDPSRDDWVMGVSGDELPPDMLQAGEMLARLNEFYFEDYGRAWKRFMRSVRYQSFSDAPTAVTYLSFLSNTTDSPLIYVLARITAETTFGDLPGGQVGQGIADAVRRQGDQVRRRVTGRATDGLGGDENMHPVMRQFVGLHALQADQAESGGAGEGLYRALEALGQVGSMLEGAADPAQAAEFAAAVVGDNGGRLNNALGQIRGGLRRLDADVRRTLFEEPVYVAWGTILGSAQRRLNERWRAEVQAEFQRTLAGTYPFDPNSRQDAPLDDFERFFRPGDGTLAAFYDEVLAPYLTQDGRPRTWGGGSIGLSGRAETALGRAQAIGEALFSGGTLQLAFELQADLPERDGDAPNPSRVSVLIHGTPDSYGLGSFRPSTPFAWPGPSGARLSVSTNRGELGPKQFEGDWAWFRLLQQADVRRTTTTQYEVRWPFREPDEYVVTAVYTLSTRSRAFPFNNATQFFAFSPPATLN